MSLSTHIVKQGCLLLCKVYKQTRADIVKKI